MATQKKTWEQLYTDAKNAQGAQQTQQQNTTDVGTVQVKAPETPSVDPSKITQSFYTTPVNETNYETGRPAYQQSEAVQQAAQAYQQQMAAKPGEYQSQYGDQIQEMINQALNRPAFSYDFSMDPMYQLYAQQYQRGGQQAMENAMAQSAALTGGYGNSYAQQVGQQTYQGYMEDLYNMLPELRDAAYQMYEAEGNTLRENLAMLQGQDESDYGRYRDTVNDWRSDVDMLYQQYGDMSEAEYNRYINDAAAWEADRAYWYQKAYDDQQQANWAAEFAAKYGDGSGSSGGGGSSRASEGTSTGGATTQRLVDLIANDAKVLNDEVYQQAAETLSDSQGFVNPLASKLNRYNTIDLKKKAGK